MDDEVWDVLKMLSLNTQYYLTVHQRFRLGIQAFEPTLVEGRAIRLHPLVTTLTMRTLTVTKWRSRSIIKKKLSTYVNACGTKHLNPKDGKPVVTPSQDMVLGNYLTLERKDAVNTGAILMILMKY